MKDVLVSVLKSQQDQRILLEEKWYRIPVSFLPKRTFTHIAFYQPIQFGKEGKRIQRYARVVNREIKKRLELLPNEPQHERANDPYLKCTFRKIEELKQPIRNVIPRRVSFGFTDLKTLHSANDILELYHVAPTEQIIERELVRLGIPVISQYRVSLKSPLAKGVPPSSEVGAVYLKSNRYRLDLAILCEKGNIAIECDNHKAHSGTIQRLKDRQKDTALKALGWRVIRLSESNILDTLDSCIFRIQKLIRSFGGVLDS